MPAKSPQKDETVGGANYRPEFDGLRGIAVVAVILNHLNPTFLPSGFLGVDIFFVISGFVVTSSLARARESSWSARIAAFYSRRVKRLLPALVVCIVVTAIAGRALVREPEEWLRTGMAALLAGANLYLWNQSTDYFSPRAELNVFTHTWSLGAEEQFYLVFPLLLGVCGFWRPSQSRGGRNVIAGILIMTAASLACFLVLSSSHSAAAFYLMPARFWELGLGGLAFLVARGRPAAAASNFKGALAALCVLSIIALLWLKNDTPSITTLLVGFLTCATLWSLEGPGAARAILASKWLVRVGLLSYSLYLWHWPVIVLSRFTVGLSSRTLPLQLLLIVTLATASYTLLERPLRYACWTGSKWGTIGVGLVASLCGLALLNWLLLPVAADLFLGDRSRPIKLQRRGVASLSEPSWRGGRIAWEARRCVLQRSRDVGLVIDLDGCTFGDWRTAARRVLVVGDSLSVAEIGMVEPLAGADGPSFTVAASWGAAPVVGVAAGAQWADASEDYWNRVVPGLLSRLRSGDAVLMISDLSDYCPEQPSSVAAGRREMLISRLELFAQEMSRRGLGVIFQSVIPFMRETGCTPQSSVSPWSGPSSVANPTCHFLTSAESLMRRDELHRALGGIQQRQRNFQLLDIFAVLCPGAVCGYTAPDGTFLFRDEYGHPSVEGASLASGALQKALSALP